jgi:hypothetical protein
MTNSTMETYTDITSSANSIVENTLQVFDFTKKIILVPYTDSTVIIKCNYCLKKEEVDLTDIKCLKEICSNCTNKDIIRLSSDTLQNLLEKPRLLKEHKYYLKCRNCNKGFKKYESRRPDICIECYDFSVQR